MGILEPEPHLLDMDLCRIGQEVKPLVGGDIPQPLAHRIGLHLEEHAKHPCLGLHTLSNHQAKEPSDHPLGARDQWCWA